MPGVTWVLFAIVLLMGAGVALMGPFALFALPVLLGAALVGWYLARSRDETPAAGDPGREATPSGVPRKSASDTETANQRVGQE